MPNPETYELPEDPWDELLHQGDVFEESVRATPAIVEALAHGTEDDEEWLYVLAAMCVGRPASRAKRIRGEANKGAETYRRLLDSKDAGVRAGAVGALCASEAATDDDRRRFAELAGSDADLSVRSAATLALGLGRGFEKQLVGLLGDAEFRVRYAAALALARLEAGDEAVVRTLVDGVGDDDAYNVTDLPPWDDLYGQPADAAATEDALPYLLQRLAVEREWVPATELADVALEVGGPEKDVVRHIVDNDAAWKRKAQLEGTLKRHGLPSGREELRAWLED